MAARRRSRRGRLHAARTRIGDHAVRHIRAPHGRGRTRGAGESRLADGAGGDLVTPFITQADRAAWQQAAAAELAAILAAHPDVPVIAWTVTASGGSLSGQVLAPAAGRRGLVQQWRQALMLEEVTETPSGNGTAGYLGRRGMRNGFTGIGVGAMVTRH